MSTDEKTQMITDKKIQMDTDKTSRINADGLYKELTYQIIGALYEVHKELGNAHKELIYHRAVAIELRDRSIPFSEEQSISVLYKKTKIGLYRPDFIIEDKVIVEIKVSPMITTAMQNQVYYYVKGTKYHLVLLANFGTSKLGLKRLIYT